MGERARVSGSAPRTCALALLSAIGLALAGCGSSGDAPRAWQLTATSQRAVSELTAAEHPANGEFPAARGRTLRQLAALARASAQLGVATSTFVPRIRRLAFGLSSSSGGFIYAPTAVYIAPTPDVAARGPFLAAEDPMTVAPRYRSRQDEGPGGINAIYATEVPVPRPGVYAILTLTRTPNGLAAGRGELAVAASSPIPDAGRRPPAIATDTPATVRGDLALLSTRIPPDDMHTVSLDQVLGRRPIALLFSTPELCASRVCGPVTDILVQAEHRFAGRITFIHQEVFVEDQPAKGLRPQLKAFHLETEPWLFTVNRRGVIAARLEGAFGVNELTDALKAALG